MDHIAEHIRQVWIATGRREEAERLFRSCFGLRGYPVRFCRGDNAAPLSGSVLRLQDGLEVCLLSTPDVPAEDWGVTALILDAPPAAGRRMEDAGFPYHQCIRRSDGNVVALWDHQKVLGLDLGLAHCAGPEAEEGGCNLSSVRLTFAAWEKEPILTLLRDTYGFLDWRYPGTVGFPNADHVECAGIAPQLQILQPLNARSGAAKWLAAHEGKQVGVCSLELRSSESLDELRARFARHQIPTGNIGTDRLAVETVALLGVALVMHAPK